MAKKKPEIPLAFRFIRWAFPKLEKIFPKLAYKWAAKLFFTPIRYGYTPEEKAMMAEAEQFTLRLNGKRLQGYSWGKGPLVLFMHGWGGRATQFRKFVPALLAKGFRVAAIDAPGHGRSTGKQTHLPEFAEGLRKLADHFGEVHAVVGHSLGGVAALLAVEQGLQVQKVVTIGSPTVAEDISASFADKLNGSQNVARFIEQWLFDTFGRTLKEFSGEEIAKRIRPLPVLVVHDTNDREAPFYHAERLAANLPQSEVLRTEGLGHFRILKDGGVVERVAGFVGEREAAQVAAGDASLALSMTRII